MAADLGQKSTVNTNLAFYLDAANSYSNPISRQGDTSPPWNDLSENKTSGKVYNNAVYLNTGTSSYVLFNTTVGGSNNKYYKTTGEIYPNLDFGTNPFAIEFWVNRYGGYVLLETRFLPGVDPHMYITFSSGQSNRLAYRPYNASVIFDTDTDQPSATDETWTGWRHYVISREGTGSNECKLYYNGSFVAQGTDANSHTTIDGVGYVLCNSWNNGSLTTDAFKGAVSLFKVYNGKALTAAEVLQNYNATKGRYGL